MTAAPTCSCGGTWSKSRLAREWLILRARHKAIRPPTFTSFWRRSSCWIWRLSARNSANATAPSPKKTWRGNVSLSLKTLSWLAYLIFVPSKSLLIWSQIQPNCDQIQYSCHKNMLNLIIYYIKNYIQNSITLIFWVLCVPFSCKYSHKNCAGCKRHTAYALLYLHRWCWLGPGPAAALIGSPSEAPWWPGSPRSSEGFHPNPGPPRPSALAAKQGSWGHVWTLFKMDPETFGTNKNWGSLII